jgi:hypothetical protein
MVMRRNTAHLQMHFWCDAGFHADGCHCRGKNGQVLGSGDSNLVTIEMHLDREHGRGAV